MGQDMSFIFAWGHPGVDLFYTLSGFLLFLPFARAYYLEKKSPDLKIYFVKRFLRILPLYYLVLLVSIFIIYPQKFMTDQALPQIAANLIFMQTFMFATPTYPAIVGVTWTLVIEMQFYIILPLVAYFFLGKRARISFPVVIVIVILYRIVMLGHWHADPSSADFNYFMASEYNIIGVFDNFAIGMVLANFYQHNLLKGVTLKGKAIIDASKKLIWAVPVILLFSLYQYYLWRFDSNQEFAWYYFSFLFDIAIYSSFAIVILFILYHRSRFREMLRMRYIGLIGVMGYSVYLIHFTIIEQVSGTELFSSIHGWSRYIILLPSVLAISIVIGIVLFRFVEKPFIDLSHTWSQKLKK